MANGEPLQIEYTTPGNYVWRAPIGVTSVCVVCVGGGGAGNWLSPGGGGGALAWKNDIPVTPGKTYTVTVGAGGTGITERSSSDAAGSIPIANGKPSSFVHDAGTVLAEGGLYPGGNNRPSAPTPATFSGADGGGNGGTCPGYYGRNSNANQFEGAGGAGAGGYTGPGGDGGHHTARNGGGGAGFIEPTAGQGGGGGGSGMRAVGTTRTGKRPSGGGGVGIYGQGADGNAGINQVGFGDRQGVDPLNVGSSGSGGGEVGRSTTNDNVAVPGAVYGGGGGIASGTGRDDCLSGDGGGGAVRIIWGDNRAYPDTNTADQFMPPSELADSDIFLINKPDGSESRYIRADKLLSGIADDWLVVIDEGGISSKCLVKELASKASDSRYMLVNSTPRGDASGTRRISYKNQIVYCS